MKKRTGIDFSKHELRVHQHSSGDPAIDDVSIYVFKKPGTNIHSIRLVNACGVLAVTGDFGNWVFCREFHPGPGEGVSDGYWDEKLEIASVQKSDEFSAEETLKAIAEFEENFSDRWGREMNEEELDWIEELKESVDDEISYIQLAYRQMPSSIDYETVPFAKTRHRWLEAVYDGFDAMCEFMSNQKQI